VIVVRGIPVYWGVETPPEDADEPFDRALATRSWMLEALPPYRESVRGIRIRVSHRHWLHVGLFKYNREPKRFGFAMSPSEIGRLGREADQERPDDDLWSEEEIDSFCPWDTFQDGDEDSMVETVERGPGDGDGADTWSPGRVVQGPTTHRHRSGMGAVGDGDERSAVPGDGADAQGAHRVSPNPECDVIERRLRGE
jgi:hypothetical protein